MKYIYKLFVMLAVASMATACDPDAESYTSGAQDPAGCQGIYFAGDYAKTVEVEPGTNSFKLTLARTETASAATVDLQVLNNDENMFVCPTTASFAAGEETTTITIDAPQAVVGVSYNLKLAVSGDNLSQYTDGYREIQVNFAILKWESIGTGYYLDGTVSTFFGVDPTMPMAVEIEKTQTASSVRFRFDSPFAKVPTDIDENGGYNGYPYNEDGDTVEGSYVFIIDVTKDGASLKPVEMGMAWSYGMFSCGSIYGYISQNIGSYPLGVYDEKAGSITFPENSLYISMAGYKDGAASPCGTPSYLYLSADAYLASLNPEK